jgi:hypothetical protein
MLAAANLEPQSGQLSSRGPDFDFHHRHAVRVFSKLGAAAVQADDANWCSYLFLNFVLVGSDRSGPTLSLSLSTFIPLFMQ